MTKDDIQDLMVGAVLVVLGYAVYRHFTAAPAQAPVKQVSMPPQPSPFTTMHDLLTGTVQDIGSYGGQNYLSKMAEPIVSGNGGNDSIVVQGGYW